MEDSIGFQRGCFEGQGRMRVYGAVYLPERTGSGPWETLDL
jgi:hypothetical protein